MSHLTLFEITDEIRMAEDAMLQYAEEHEGDITDFPLMEIMEKLEGDKNEKLLGWGVWFKNNKAESEAFKKEIKNLQARKKRVDTNLEFIKNNIFQNMDVKTLTNSKCELMKVGMKKAVEVNCKPEQLPERYQIVATTIESTDLETIKMVLKKLPENSSASDLNFTANKPKILAEFEKEKKLPDDLNENVRIKDKYLRIK